MRRSDEHLEQALKEYNDRISALESKKGLEELYLEALVNRSSILMMLEYYTSATEDTEDAINLAEEMIEAGMKVDTGTYVKMYDNHGQMMYDSDNEAMAADYDRILSVLNGVEGDIRHYTKHDLIEMCIGCAGDLMDIDDADRATPFLLKAFALLGTDTDTWSLNKRLATINEMARVDMSKGLDDCAITLFDDAIGLGSILRSTSELDSPMELVESYVSKGDLLEKKEDFKGMWREHECAIEILEELYSENRLEDVQILAQLHQGLATSMMNAGEIKAAEKHLMRSVNLGVPGMKEAMEALTDRHDD